MGVRGYLRSANSHLLIWGGEFVNWFGKHLAVQISSDSDTFLKQSLAYFDYLNLNLFAYTFVKQNFKWKTQWWYRRNI